MPRWKIATTCFVSVCALSACSGGSGGSGPANPGNPTPDYVAFTNSTSATDTTLGGQAINTDTNAITAVTGTLTHDTRAITDFAASGVTLSDSDGDTAGTWTDGTTTLSPSSAQSGSYDFAALYNMQNATGSAAVVVGATTRTADVPTTGSVTYTGEALLQGTSINGAMTAQGNSTVAVDLANRTAEVTVNGIGGIAYDVATISGVALSTDRTGLSGGTLALTNGGADVTTVLLGADNANTLAGDFFGLGSDGNPDEVGGVFHSTGSNGELSGSFLAD